LAIIVFMISSGVALASHGELRFNLIGFLIQAAAVGVRPVFHLFFFAFSVLPFICTLFGVANRPDSITLNHSSKLRVS
jgi:hypothetical protein